MKTGTLLLLLGLLLAGCVSTPYQSSGLQLPKGAEETILGPYGIRIHSVRDLVLFPRGMNEYLAASVEIEHNIPDHWEDRWIGRVLLRRPLGSTKWTEPPDTADIPDIQNILISSEEELESIFNQKEQPASNKTGGR